MSKLYKFRVSRFLKRDLVVRVNSLGPNGIIRSSRKLIEFYPENKLETEGWYETTDAVLINSLAEHKETIPWSKQAELGLEQDGVEYDFTFCASCGNNRVKKLQYNLFEIVSND